MRAKMFFGITLWLALNARALRASDVNCQPEIIRVLGIDTPASALSRALSEPKNFYLELHRRSIEALNKTGNAAAFSVPEFHDSLLWVERNLQELAAKVETRMPLDPMQEKSLSEIKALHERAKKMIGENHIVYSDFIDLTNRHSIAQTYEDRLYFTKGTTRPLLPIEQMYRDYSDPTAEKYWDKVMEAAPEKTVSVMNHCLNHSLANNKTLLSEGREFPPSKARAGSSRLRSHLSPRQYRI